MSNASAIETSTRRAGTTSLNGCHLLPSQNSSLAAHWENIPETALLNGVIGATLFVLFLIMTKIAWQRHGKDDRLAKQNIISFLYGYRDPEHWYLIPRFEFLRPDDRHHHHDLQSPYLYVPPRLPLANPIEVFGYDSDMGLSDSRDSIGDPTRQWKSPPHESSPQSDIKSAKTMPVGSPSNSRNQPVQQQLQQQPQQQQQSNSAPPSPSPSEGKAKKDRRANDSGPLHQSFFYPSILQAEQRQASWLSRKLNSFFSKFYRATDADIIYAKGIDAYEYLLFQRHLILLMFITNIVCLGIIFPIHWMNGSYDGNLSTSFQRSTIKNMGTTTNYYWVHITCSVLIVTCALFILKSYKESILTRSDPQVSRRTILVGNIPQEQRSRPTLLNVFKEYFPSVTVEAIQFVYDTNRLADYQLDLSSVMVAKDYCTYYKNKHKKELMVHRTDVNTARYCNGNCRLCSFLLICCCYWPCESKEPGTVYYTKEEQKCREQIADICKSLIDEPTEYAFVTFKSHRQAKRVMHDLAQFKQEASEDKQISPKGRNVVLGKSVESVESNQSLPKQFDKVFHKDGASNKSKFLETTANETQDPLDPTSNPHIRSIRSPAQLKKTDTTLARGASDSPATLRAKLSSKDKTKSRRYEGPLTWSIRYAPHPDNVGFRDLLFLAKASKFTTALLHFLMIIIFMFITTPNVVLSMIERADILQPDKAKQLTGFQGLVINYLSILIQIITTALLPSLITQISKQIPYEDASSKDHSVMWKVYLFLVLMIIILPSIGMSSAQALLSSDIDPKCLFPTDNGAYFINYVISSIFISTIFELIKPSDVVYYYFILLTSRSSAELEGGRQFIDSEFPVGLHHTNVLLIFSVVMTYCISCPLIAPFGLVYLLVKHSVDHYHLYYSYFTKKVDRNLQGTIVVFVRVALLLMLFQTTVAISINTGTSYFSLVSQIVFWITLAGCMFNCFMDCTSRTLPSTKRNKFQQEFCACFYLPRVIQDLLKCDAIPASCISRKV